jgi:hypothetical protein
VSKVSTVNGAAGQVGTPVGEPAVIVVQSTKLKFDADAGGLVSTVIPTTIAAPMTAVRTTTLVFISFPLFSYGVRCRE